MRLCTLAVTLLVAAALPGAAAAAAPPLSVSGNALLAGGQPAQLRGVNYGFMAADCIYSDPEPNVATTTAAMQSWGVNAVRLHVDAGCWQGSGGRPSNRYADAAAYRAAVATRAAQFEAAGFWVVLDPYGTDYMPSPAINTFWASAAAGFAGDHSMVFDLYNEVALDQLSAVGPLTGGNRDNPAFANPTAAPWDCWKSGCTVNSTGGGHFAGVGMQTLVNTIRGTGATQPIMVGSLGYNSELGEWLSHVPADPQGAIVLDQHRYDFIDSSGGGSAGFAGFDSYLTGEVAPIAQLHPTVLGELGEIHCDDGLTAYSAHALSSIDALQTAQGLTVSVLGWDWQTSGGGYGCPTGDPPGYMGPGGPLLLRDYAGTPTAEGAAFRSWFLAHRGSQPPSVDQPGKPTGRRAAALKKCKKKAKKAKKRCMKRAKKLPV